MKVCFPVERNDGVDSVVFGHFGSAPLFIMIDRATGEVSEVANGDLNHAHGACQPIKAISGQPVNAVVVGGIGRGALVGLNRAGIGVYKAGAATVRDNMALLASGSLVFWGEADTCAGHGHGHGHGHGCAHG